jgi:hypothetical protein
LGIRDFEAAAGADWLTVEGAAVAPACEPLPELEIMAFISLSVNPALCKVMSALVDVSYFPGFV